MIRFHKAQLGYGRHVVLSDVSLEIAAGDFVGVVGPNGSGKTTILRSLLGLLPPLSGTVTADRKRRFAYVPQVEELNAFWPLTVREVVALAHRSRHVMGRLSEEQETAIDRAIKRAGIVDLENSRYDELSGGQRQRTLLAQALSQNPEVLLLDEPTRGLDAKAERDLLDLLSDVNEKEGMAIVLVTHTLAIPINTTEKILLVHDGRVISTTADEIFQTRKLEEIYGLPFVHSESGGIRWISLARRP
jgi:ABC-type Mn2+/Zn2+ transport system ATPase subunit